VWDYLRNTIINACIIEKSKIHNKQDLLMKKDGFFDSSEFLNIDKELLDQYWAIERSLRASIPLRPVCFKSNKKMICNPIRKTFNCTECYEKLKWGNIERGMPEEFS
jgi:hypothetical protein